MKKYNAEKYLEVARERGWKVDLCGTPLQALDGDSFIRLQKDFGREAVNVSSTLFELPRTMVEYAAYFVNKTADAIQMKYGRRPHPELYGDLRAKGRTLLTSIAQWCEFSGIELDAKDADSIATVSNYVSEMLDFADTFWSPVPGSVKAGLRWVMLAGRYYALTDDEYVVYNNGRPEIRDSNYKPRWQDVLAAAKPGDVLKETDTYRICATGHDYDFVAWIENKTDNILVAVDEYGNDDGTFSFRVDPHNWIGFLADASGYAMLGVIIDGSYSVQVREREVCPA